jgi:DNA-binding IscR family transcriptional regulator
MEPRTERILRALGTREAYSLVCELLRSDLTTSALSEATKLSVPTTERVLETLSQGSLVARRSGTQGAWYVVHWPETVAILHATRRLGIAITGTEERVDRSEEEFFNDLDQAGAAAPAPQRGRRRTESD